ncbi:unnamed protein product [Cylindrotheca closterium]|uniref:DUS-like FMN-binding domain-containing protein n=1 Tax=Cylindrotheca closterium TaxID=2856 RepID=A0AAD2CDS8_9STRA|nr:unnamed protein product [Cylindrotheca closterium]
MTNSLFSWSLIPILMRAIISTIILRFCFLKNDASTVHGASVTRKNVDFHVAPMQCYTNLAFRRLCSNLSPTSTYWTEMEKADDLMPNIRESLIQRLLGDDPRRSDTSYYHHHQEQERRLVLQLGSNDPRKVQECVKAAMALEYKQLKEINLNCGCPAIDSGGAPTYGASLMKDPTLTASLVESCVQSCWKEGRNKVDVSVKCRIGVVDHADDLLDTTNTKSTPASPSSSTLGYDYGRLHDYVSHIENAGANHVILHARPAVLAGLSPVKNRIVPTLQYEMVRQIAKDFPNLKVTLNGGIRSLSQLKYEITASDGDEDGAVQSGTISSFMAGRWILQRPLDLIGIEGWLQQQQRRPRPEATNNGPPSSLSPTPPLELDAANPDAFVIAKHALEDYLDYCLQQQSASSTSSSTSTSTKTKNASSITTTITTTTTTTTASDLCLPLFLVVEQLREDYDDDNNDGMEVPPPMMLSYEEMESLYDLLQDGISELSDCMGKGNHQKKKSGHKDSSSVNFKRLSTSFKSLVGTKVANKWKRNRAELS